MAAPVRNISLALAWNERYDHKIAVGIIKFARQRPDINLFGNEWLFQNRPGPDQPIDGIIARITSRQDLARLRRHNTPVVDIANAYAEAGLPQAMNDDILTGRMAAGHLLQKGFIHLAYLGIDEATWSNQRRLGVMEMLAETGGPELIHYSVANSWQRRLYNLSGLARWLAKLPRPCGIMAANDLLGYRITHAAAMAGLRIPDDIGVVGVDNEDVYCHLSQPALTSISCDCERIGMEAARLLVQILNGEDPLHHVVVAPLQIDARESTSIVIGEDRLTRDVKNFIAARVGSGINVADICAAFPLSRRALEKRFRQHAGSTLHDAIAGARLEKAQSLLLSGKSPAAASYESGYRTIQHFYHAFKARFDCTPLEFTARERK